MFLLENSLNMQYYVGSFKPIVSVLSMEMMTDQPTREGKAHPETTQSVQPTACLAAVYITLSLFSQFRQLELFSLKSKT